MAIAAGVLIAAYIIALIVGLAWPQRQHHPEDGMAVGCLMMCIAALAALAIVLAVAAHYHARWLVNVIFVATVFPTVALIPQLTIAGVKKRHQRKIDRGVPIPAGQLADRLRGQTHVMHVGSADPPREWNDLYYFAPDGRIVRYKEEAGRIEHVDDLVTWTIEDGRLVTLNDIQPGNRIAYTLADTPDGRIAYYIHMPGTRAHGVLSRRTSQVRAGEPIAGNS